MTAGRTGASQPRPPAAVFGGRAVVAVGRAIGRARDADRARCGGPRYGRHRSDAPRSRLPARGRGHRGDVRRGPGRPARGRLPAHPGPGPGLPGGRAGRRPDARAERCAVPFGARRQRDAVGRGRVPHDGRRHRGRGGDHRHPLADEQARCRIRNAAAARAAGRGPADVAERVTLRSRGGSVGARPLPQPTTAPRPEPSFRPWPEEPAPRGRRASRREPPPPAEPIFAAPVSAVAGTSLAARAAVLWRAARLNADDADGPPERRPLRVTP